MMAVGAGAAFLALPERRLAIHPAAGVDLASPSPPGRTQGVVNP